MFIGGYSLILSPLSVSPSSLGFGSPNTYTLDFEVGLVGQFDVHGRVARSGIDYTIKLRSMARGGIPASVKLLSQTVCLPLSL